MKPTAEGPSTSLTAGSCATRERNAVILSQGGLPRIHQRGKLESKDLGFRNQR